MSPRYQPKGERDARRRHLEICRAELERAKSLPPGPGRLAAIDRAAAAMSDAVRTRTAPKPAKGGSTAELNQRAAEIASKMPSSVSVKPRPVYGPRSPHSYFVDLMGAKRADGDARERLATVGRERRDITTAASFLAPAASPLFVAEHFGAALRSRAPIAAALTQLPLPTGSMTVALPSLTTGATVASPTAEGGAVSKTDIVEASAASPVGTIVGAQSLSQQLLDRGANGAMDAVIPSDLGFACAEELDRQILSGTGSNEQILGLGVVSGLTAVTATNATPTGATNLLAIGKLVGTVAEATHIVPDLLIMAPRRAAYIMTKLAITPAWPTTRQPLLADAIGLVGGASTNADSVFAIVSDTLLLLLGGLQFSVTFPGSNTLTARCTAYLNAALVIRQPKAIGLSTGTEWVVPAW